MMTSGLKKGFRVDIAMLRLLSIFIVVAFHAYGMCYAQHLPPPLPSLYKETYWYFNQCIPINMAMPLFMVISGYLFTMQLLRGKYGSLWQAAKDKFRRLGIPYYFFTPIMMATYSGFSLSPFYSGNYWHLWFLPGLWCTLMAVYLLRNLIFSGKPWVAVSVLLASFALYLIRGRQGGDTTILPHVFGLSHLTSMLGWCVLGSLLCKYESRIDAVMEKYRLVWPVMAVYLVQVIFFPSAYGEKSISSIVGGCSSIIALWYLFHRIPWEKLRLTPLLLKLSSFTFGIYIFHNWVEVYLVSSPAKRMFPIEEFAANHIILFPALFTLSAFAISALLTMLCLRTRLGRWLLG